MNARGAFQLLVFLGILAGYYYVAWPILTKEALAVGTVLGILMHWGLTNKGNRDIVNLHPFGGGFRVLFYDILLATLLTALVLGGQLSLLWTATEFAGLAVLLVGAILLDYSVKG